LATGQQGFFNFVDTYFHLSWLLGNKSFLTVLVLPSHLLGSKSSLTASVFGHWATSP
jgi:hypothetical protein